MKGSHITIGVIVIGMMFACLHAFSRGIGYGLARQFFHLFK